MKKYLGAPITVYAACMACVFVIGPIIFAFIILSVGINPGTIFVALYCVLCAIVWIIYLRKVSDQLYSWGNFGDKSIKIRTGISKKYVIEYAKCKDIGIGMYIHGILNSNVGTKVYFIFFSYERFDEKYRFDMNLWKPSTTRIKVGFSKKLYRYLLTVLPEYQALALKRDYEKYKNINKKPSKPKRHKH